MKHVVLAAGYATRLYPVTENFPKPLLKVGGMTILDRLIMDMDSLKEIDHHLIVSNHRFLPLFKKWANESCYSKEITIIDDGSVDNENRLGAINDLLFAIETCQLQEDDLLVIAADNVVDFSFQGFVDYFKDKQTSLIMTYHEPEIAALRRTGVITLDPNNRVLDMQEKPENPKSFFAAPPFYIYKKSDITLLQLCLPEGRNADSPGNLVKLMLDKTTFHAWPMPGKRYDIGTLEMYYQLKDNLQL